MDAVGARNTAFARPLSRVAAEAFFAIHEAAADRSEADQLRYLQLKYFHDAHPWRWLNQLGRHFLREGRTPVARLCWLSSLRLNSIQPDVFDLCRSVETSMVPPPLTAVRPPGECAVSVIMPTYKRGPAILDSVRSVLSQTWRDLELVVVNDGGDDAAGEVVKSLNDPRVRYLRLDRNRGEGFARNTALQAAKGRWIAFLDDDDVYLADHIATLVEALADGGYRVGYTNTNAVHGRRDGMTFVREREAFLWNEAFDRDRLLRKIFITPCSIMVDRAVLASSGLFVAGLPMSADWELWLRCALDHPFRHIDRVTSEYRLLANNMTISDRVGAFFFGAMVTEYHAFVRGEIAYAKYFARVGDLAEARRRYEVILERKRNYYRHDGQLEEIAALARLLHDGRTVHAVTKEYFGIRPRGCLRAAATRWSPLSRKALVPLALGWAIRRLGHRARRVLRGDGLRRPLAYFEREKGAGAGRRRSM
ncbi:MAG: glycosyltransferase family 2 protein [Candidatus Rokuibacteriota bacterium]